MHFVCSLFASVAHDRSNLIERSNERYGFLRVVGVDDVHGCNIRGEVHHRDKTNLIENADSGRYNVLKLEIFEGQVHILSCLLHVRFKELCPCSKELLIYICGLGSSCHFLCPPWLFSFFGFDTLEIVNSLFRHCDVETSVYLVNGQLVIVVDDTVFRERIYFRFGIVLGFHLEDFSVSLVRCGVHSVHLLNGLLFTVHHMIGFSVLRPGFGDNLKLENIIATIDGVFDRRSVYKELLEGGSHNHTGVIDIESTSRSDTLHEIAAFGFCFAVRLNLNVVIYVFLRYLDNGIFLEVKACTRLPFSTDSGQCVVVFLIALDHDTVRVELDNSQSFNLLVTMLCKFQ